MPRGCWGSESARSPRPHIFRPRDHGPSGRPANGARRALRAPPRAGQGRHGHRLSGVRRQASPRGRAQSAAARPHRVSWRGAVPPRTAWASCTGTSSPRTSSSRRAIRSSPTSAWQVSQLGRAFSWVASPGASQRKLEIVVSVRGGRTRITIQESLGPLIGAIFGGFGGGMGGGGVWPVIAIFLGAFHLPASSIAAIIPLWLTTTYATARTAYHRSSGRRARELEAVADRLAALARELAPTRPALRPPSGA